ncbi:LmeA family phospholipid-binding protein [Kitasatospora sp. NBC_00458]|uniref:LmeA family phospholipid-binding protein n=1 Tax=Kitasatospora sp. NBC_00458 TaxID=2903568 RepID=UPI002E187B2A
MRGWVKATIGLAVLAGVLVGADRVAVGVAEDEAADQLVKSGRMSQRPDVSIEGFPFLTQVVSMKLDEVRISADGLTVGDGSHQVALHSFRAKLSGVKVSDNKSSATVDDGSGTGLISYADLSQLLPPASQLLPNATGLSMGGNTRLTLSYGGPGKIKAAFGPVPVGEGTVHSQGNTVTAEGFRLTGVAAVLAGLSSRPLEPVSFTLSSLPAGLNLSEVTPKEDGLQLSFVGKGVKLIG